MSSAGGCWTSHRVLFGQVNKDWNKLDNCVLGHILRSPAITPGVGEHPFTEDWGMFQVNLSKLDDGFQGNKMDLGAFDYPIKTIYQPKCHLYLGTKLTSGELTVKCFPRRDANWEFEYPEDRLPPLTT